MCVCVCGVCVVWCVCVEGMVREKTCMQGVGG